MNLGTADYSLWLNLEMDDMVFSVVCTLIFAGPTFCMLLAHHLKTKRSAAWFM